MVRKAIFTKRLMDIQSHNAKLSSWKKGVNHLTDLSDDELLIRNGFRPELRDRPSALSLPGSSSSLLELDASDKACASQHVSCLSDSSQCCTGLVCGASGTCVAASQTHENFDWTYQFKTAHSILDQGQCGSCWAVAATAVLQFYAEAASDGKFRKTLSPQSMLSCTPNEHECGGTGGCGGATAELGYEWLKSLNGKGGLLPLDLDPYLEKAQCEARKPSFLQTRSSPGVYIQGWKRLPENDPHALMTTLTNVGPLAISIAAGTVLGSYDSGVIAHADTSRVLDHAVVLMGYGFDDASKMPYWKIRNTWGSSWGERGFFRLQRFAPFHDEPCGWDEEPDKGIACKNADGQYPKRQRVCGAAGMLSDSSYPVGVVVPTALHGHSEASDDQMEGSREGTAGTILVTDNAQCKTQCQRFNSGALSAMFNRFFGDNDVAKCLRACDTIVFSGMQ
eukprot:TRINITY_DN26161_c0_g1_i1.p1 TRINITY_DN26161_c0_g1~~TRINITY_DN26161_c0_g1_i1.p1  ORF type:complete len:509 (-),score=29.11 TRINITY_DN26161_c0_g1_i1:125-1474(-)